MKKKIFGIIRVLIFLLILGLCFIKIYDITLKKQPHIKMKDFFSQEQDFDVLFFGSSHTINAILPMELWNNYGIVSYNLGNHAERLTVTYYNMLMALEHTNPKLVVIDTYYASDIKKAEKRTEAAIHTALDAYPICKTKYLAIKDLFEGQNIQEKEIEYLFNFSIYHSRWKELDKWDFVDTNQFEKGGESRINVAKPNKMSDFASVPPYNVEESINMKYLRKIIEHCKQNNIEVLITHLPYPARDCDIGTSKYIQTICDDYDVNYINFLNMDLVDFDIDCYDKNSHVNVSGARKVTKYLGKYIMDNYDIKDKRSNKEYSFWNQDYREYIGLKHSYIRRGDSLDNCLILLYDEKDLYYDIKISSKKEIENGSVLQKLLANIGNNYKIDDTVFENNKDKTIKIIVGDKKSKQELEMWF